MANDPLPAPPQPLDPERERVLDALYPIFDDPWMPSRDDVSIGHLGELAAQRIKALDAELAVLRRSEERPTRQHEFDCPCTQLVAGEDGVVHGWPDECCTCKPGEARPSAEPLKALIEKWRSRCFVASAGVSGMPGAWTDGVCPHCGCTAWAHAWPWQHAANDLEALLFSRPVGDAPT